MLRSRETWILTSVGPEARLHAASVPWELLGGVKVVAFWRVDMVAMFLQVEFPREIAIYASVEGFVTRFFERHAESGGGLVAKSRQTKTALFDCYRASI
jgi:hypothetical protein